MLARPADGPIRTFLDHTEGHELHRLWVLAATTGLRRSELVGLRWQSVDLDARLLTVRWTVMRTGEHESGLEDAQESTTSARSIHLDTVTATALGEQRAWLTSLRRQLGGGWNPDGIVFPDADGTWRIPNSVTAAFRRAVAAAHRDGRGAAMSDRPAPLSATTAASYPRGRGRSPVSSVEVELDDELLALVDRSAQTTGRDRSQVIADAVRRRLTASPLHAIINRPSTGDDLDEDAAMRLAISEQLAYRAERDSA